MQFKKEGVENICCIPWNHCEEFIIERAKAVGSKELIFVFSDGSRKDVIFKFLQELEFLEPKSTHLSELGNAYYTFKYITEERIKADSILNQQLRKLRITQAICQTLWGKSNITRRNVYNLLASRGFIDHYEVKEDDIGPLLMLLNQFGILSYSKKTQAIRILYNPADNDDSIIPPKDAFLTPEKPYSNVRHLRQALRSCEDYINWVDRHFDLKGFEPLDDEADSNKIKTIKILTAVHDSFTDKLKNDFERFRDEMSNRGIIAELRVIIDKEFRHGTHDRWIIGKNICYNVPPVNTIYKGQASEIKQTSNRPPFDEWWSIGLPLLEKNEEIMKEVERLKQANGKSKP